MGFRADYEAAKNSRGFGHYVATAIVYGGLGWMIYSMATCEARPPATGTTKAAAAPEKPTDVDAAFTLVNLLQSRNLIMDGDVSGWNHTIDLHISSLLPGDARDTANVVCQQARRLHKWDPARNWTVRVFLTINSKTPAGRCNI